MFDVSKNAVERIKEIALKEKHEYFRISVDGGGCQGFSYKFNFDKPPVKTWIRDYVRVAATNSITKEVVATNTFPATDLHGNFTGLPITTVQFIFNAIIVYTNNKQGKPYIYPFSSWTTTSICNSDSLYLNATSHKLAN